VLDNDMLDKQTEDIFAAIAELFIFAPEPQEDVAEFHAACGLGIASTPAIRNPELRIRLIEEEAREATEKIEEGDLTGSIKELCDLLYVTYGAFVEFGVNCRPFWEAVHRSNMTKIGGPKKDGKQLKPTGWKAPDLETILKSDESKARYCVINNETFSALQDTTEIPQN
jgi:predicted HAD superfamily Cof-like phosphohydrolase